MGRLQNLWVEAPMELPRSQWVEDPAAVHTAAAAVAADRIAVDPVEHCCRPLGTSWSRRTWRATGRARNQRTRMKRKKEHEGLGTGTTPGVMGGSGGAIARGEGWMYRRVCDATRGGSWVSA